MEEIILLILLFLTMLTTFCMYKMLEKRGLFFALVIMNIISLVLSFKITNVFKLNINIGIVSTIAIFSILYLYILKYGSKDKKNLLLTSLYSNIIASVLLIIMNFLVPAITETISINMQGTFEYNYKIFIVFPTIIFISEYLTIKLFDLVLKIQDNVVIGIILTYVIIGLLYTVIFSITSYIGILEIKSSLFIGISSYIIGIPITVFNASLINYLNNKKVAK